MNGTTSTATTLAAPLIERLRSGTLAIRTGRNDTTKSDYSQSACLAQIAGMINRMTPLWKQVVVMGVMQTYGWVPTAYGGTFNSTIGVDGLIKASVDLAAKSFFDNDLAFNAALKAQVGASYFDVLANHTSAGLTSTVTLGGTTYTYLTTAGCGDGTHETTTGAANTLTGLLATISAKGF